MRTRLGESDLEISRVVLGSMGHGNATRGDRARILDAAIDHGITSIDTAPLYGFGEVERELGEALAGRRGAVELLSKVGLRWDAEHGEVLFEFEDEAGQRRAVRRDSRPVAIRRDVEASLARLRTDHLDLCQIHHPDRRVPIAEAVGTLEDLVAEGKIRALGVSNFTGPEIEGAIAALTREPLASDQLEYNLIKRTADREIVPLARRHGFGLLAYSPLDAGSLAGKLLESDGAAAHIEDGRRNRVTFQGENATQVNEALVRLVNPIAHRHDATFAQIGLAWILHEPGFSAVVVGASSPDQIRVNAEAASLQLDESERRSLAEGFAGLTLQVPRGEPLTRRARRFLGRLRRSVWG